MKPPLDFQKFFIKNIQKTQKRATPLISLFHRQLPPKGEAFTKAIFQTKKKSELFFIRQSCALPPFPKGKALSRKDFPFLPKKFCLLNFPQARGILCKAEGDFHHSDHQREEGEKIQRHHPKSYGSAENAVQRRHER